MPGQPKAEPSFSFTSNLKRKTATRDKGVTVGDLYDAGVIHFVVGRSQSLNLRRSHVKQGC